MSHPIDIGLPRQESASAFIDWNDSSRPVRFHAPTIRLFAATIVEPKKHYEFRGYECERWLGWIVPGRQYPRTYTGRYNSAPHLGCDAEVFDGVNAFLCPNPCLPPTTGRPNTLQRTNKGEGVSDNQIATLDWLSIDIDPVARLREESATADELSAAIELRDRILTEQAVIRTSSLWLCTGNGGGILLRLPSYPNDAEHRKLLRDVLRSLDARYSGARAKVDINTANPSRGIGVPGTMKCKGGNLPDRPWRFVTIDGSGGELVNLQVRAGLESYGRKYAVAPVDLVSWYRDNPAPDVPKPASHIAAGTSAGPPCPRSHDEHEFRLRRAEAYLQAMQPAISGCGGHAATFRAACVLIKGFALSIDEAWPILAAWNNTHCDPPWADWELHHKLESADSKSDDRPRGYLYEAPPRAPGDPKRKRPADIPMPPPIDLSDFPGDV